MLRKNIYLFIFDHLNDLMKHNNQKKLLRNFIFKIELIE